MLLGAIALGGAWFGALLVLFYGIGMATALVDAGPVLVLAGDRFERWSFLRPESRELPAAVIAPAGPRAAHTDRRRGHRCRCVDRHPFADDHLSQRRGWADQLNVAATAPHAQAVPEAKACATNQHQGVGDVVDGY